MKKTIIFIIAFICSTATFAQNESILNGMNVGIGVPTEFYDLKAAGTNIHLGYDYAHPVSDKFSIGLYVSAAGGFLGSFHPYNEYDKLYSMFRFSAGLLCEIGDLDYKPYLFGISPCIGLGFVDMDLVLPVEFRFGRVFSNWYVMGELLYGISLADETICIEPSIRIGYNFGPRKRSRKK